MEAAQAEPKSSPRILSPATTRWTRDPNSPAKTLPPLKEARRGQSRTEKRKGNDLFMTRKHPSFKHSHPTQSYLTQKEEKENQFHALISRPYSAPAPSRSADLWRGKNGAPCARALDTHAFFDTLVPSRNPSSPTARTDQGENIP
jgi:hypothetical protein